jgi:hypothetical protein
MENGKDNYNKVLEQYKRAVDAWGKWAHTWGLLNNKAQQGDLLAHNQAAWDARADEVAVSGKAFVDAYMLAHKKTQSLYMHLLVTHTPDMIRRFGDLRSFQS